MTGPTHVLLGISSAVVTAYLTPYSPKNVFHFLAVVIGSLAPDLDGNGTLTKPGTVLKRFVGVTAANVIDSLFAPFPWLIRKSFGHRGFTHAPLFAFLLLGAAIITESELLFWFSIGYLSHLVGDAITVSGIPLYSPLRKERISFSPIRVGGLVEKLVATLLLLFVIIYGWKLLPEEVQKAHVKFLNTVSQR